MAEALGLAASVISVVDLFVKVGVLCSVYCADVRRAPTDVRCILNEADRLTATLKEVERLLAGPNGARFASLENVQRNVADCQRQVAELAIKLQEGMKYKKLLWPLKKQEVIGRVADFERCRHAIALDLHINQTTLLLDVHQQIVLAKLRTAEGATFDSHANAGNAKCHPDTRLDILRKIETWAGSPDSKCVLWLDGQAGMGKSTISRTIAQAFANQGSLGASFFFKRGEGDRGRTTRFFTTIAAQLVRQVPSLALHVRDAIESDPIIHEKSLRDQFDKLIAGPVEKLPKCQHPPLMLVVVDALDECGGDEWQTRNLIYLLSQANVFTTLRLKFFITSRPELPIRLGFQDIAGKYEVYLLHDIPPSVVKHDIGVFLRDEMARIRNDYNRSVTTNRQLPAGWPGTEPIEKLVEMAIPLFIVATTFCRFIQDRRLGGPRSQLLRLLEHKTSGTSGLDMTYLPVLDSLLLDLSSLENQRVIYNFKMIIGSIITLANPLSIPSLAHLLAVPVDLIEDQLDELHSVLSIIPDSDTPVRLLHLSFRDFLVNPEKAANPKKYPFWVDEKQSHRQLAVMCLELLNKTLKRDICGLKLPGTSRLELNQQTIDGALAPEVQYACHYWVYHYEEGNCRIRDGSLVDSFLKVHFLHWLEALGLLGGAREASSMLDKLLNQLEPENSNKIAELLHDARRVILEHRSIIDAYPLQVYYSTIMFAPEQCIIRKAFKDQMPTWISLPQVDSRWSACLQTFEGNDYFTCPVTFSPDSTLLASPTYAGQIRIWDIRTGNCATTLRGQHAHHIQSLAFSDSVLLRSASRDGVVKTWNAVTGNCMESVTFGQEHSYGARLVLAKNSQLLAVLPGDTPITSIWDIQTQKMITEMRGDRGKAVQDLRISPDSRFLAFLVGYAVWLYDIATGARIITLDDYIDYHLAIAFSSDSTLLAVGNVNWIDLWDINKANPTRFEEHGPRRTHSEEFCQSVSLSNTLALVVTGLSDGRIKLWDTKSGNCISTFEAHNDMVLSVVFSDDSTLLASTSLDENIKIWDTASLHSVPEGRVSRIRHIVFSHTSTLLASRHDGSIRVWDSETGQCAMVVNEQLDNGPLQGGEHFALQGTIYKVSISAETEDIKIRDITSGSCIRTLPTRELLDIRDPKIGRIALSHDLKQLALTSDDRLTIIDVASGKYIATLVWTRRLVQTALTFSGDSTLIAVAEGMLADRYFAIRIWNIATGECRASLESGPSISALAFSQSLTFIASAETLEGFIMLWHIDTGASMKIIEVGVDITYLAFDAADSSLHTNIGMFELNDSLEQLQNTPSEEPVADATVGETELESPMSEAVADLCHPVVRSVSRRGAGISVDGAWVIWDHHKVLWVPPAYRSGDLAVIGSTVVFGRPSGEVIFMTLAPDPGLFPQF